MLPGYEISTWHGVLAPARTPRPEVDRLNKEIVAVLALPDIRANLMANGFEPIGSTPERLSEYMKSEMVKWAKVVKESGAKVE